MCECFIFKQGIIQPHSEKEIALHITAECLEEVSTMAYFMIFGSSDAPLVGLMNFKLTFPNMRPRNVFFFFFKKEVYLSRKLFSWTNQKCFQIYKCTLC